MQFIKTNDWHPAIATLQTRLETELASGKQVLWLVSGGSNISASVTIMHNLAAASTQKLTVMLMDERYGVVGHPDSNAGQLLQAGFDVKAGHLLQILLPNTSFVATRDHFQTIAQEAFANSDIVIGQFGIGSDGHIAGILPHSAAVDSADFVAAYASPPYQRLTLTDHALKRVAAAYALAYGTDKKPALALLATKLVPYAEQPSQILKELPEAYVFNDQLDGDQ